VTEPAAAPPRVLVADDEPAITTLMADMLAYAGFGVLRAHGARRRSSWRAPSVRT
jgi:DNA-binding response OmpR family regulator